MERRASREWLDIDDIDTDHDRFQQELPAISVIVNVIDNIQDTP